jgi:hypothetical protein
VISLFDLSTIRTGVGGAANVVNPNRGNLTTTCAYSRRRELDRSPDQLDGRSHVPHLCRILNACKSSASHICLHERT